MRSGAWLASHAGVSPHWSCDTPSRLSISLGDIQNAPTWRVLVLFVGFLNFWSVAPTFVPWGGGVCVYFLKSVRKCCFRNVCVGGGVGGHIFEHEAGT